MIGGLLNALPIALRKLYVLEKQGKVSFKKFNGARDLIVSRSQEHVNVVLHNLFF